MQREFFPPGALAAFYLLLYVGVSDGRFDASSIAAAGEAMLKFNSILFCHCNFRFLNSTKARLHRPPAWTPPPPPSSPPSAAAARGAAAAAAASGPPSTRGQESSQGVTATLIFSPAYCTQCTVRSNYFFFAFFFFQRQPRRSDGPLQGHQEQERDDGLEPGVVGGQEPSSSAAAASGAPAPTGVRLRPALVLPPLLLLLLLQQPAGQPAQGDTQEASGRRRRQGQVRHFDNLACFARFFLNVSL